MSLQRLHLLTMAHPFFINDMQLRSSPNKLLTQKKKKHILRRARDTQISLAENIKLLIALNDL